MLVSDIASADVGKIESWCRQHVVSVPHDLIIRVLLQPVYSKLQDQNVGFETLEVLHKAAKGCLRWPGDVVRQSLRASPSLLACLLQLRTALKSAD